MYRRSLIAFHTCLLLAFLAATPAMGDQLEIVVNGLDEPLLGNVRARTQSFRIAGNTRLSRRRLERFRSSAELRAQSALRPFGYYQAVVHSELVNAGERNWKLILNIQKGPPVIIADYRVRVAGPGADDPSLLEWEASWPLTEGLVLNQITWEEQKTRALDLAEAHGYLSAAFGEQRIELDLEQNRASLFLTLDTGEQAVMGAIVFNQDQVKPGVLEHLPRFSEGEPYDAWLMEQFRLDLWRTGFFENIEVLEERRLDDQPPKVNLVVNLEPRKPNTYQGGLGFGSDTGFRAQLLWSRHLLSSRGDSLDVGIGWQEKDSEFSFRTNYRYPRRVSGRQYWTAELLYRTEQQNFTISPSSDPGRRVTVARGETDDYSFKPGWLKVRGLYRGHQQIFEHWYLQFLRERTDFRPIEEPPPEPAVRLGFPVDPNPFAGTSETLSVGVSWDWPAVRGNAFETVGHSHRAWIFTSNETWGSDIDFSQIYLSTRWNTIFKERWKFLWRGEIGYSDADVSERTVESGGERFVLSVTELPSEYRFKAGGSQSVRGYGFEDLSNNNIGSNNIVTASVELEMKFAEDWSAAAFIDVGNAFNDWDQTRLKKGAGVGIRWYSIAGAIRLDVAQALDEAGEPWRIHFTIGSPLL